MNKKTVVLFLVLVLFCFLNIIFCESQVVVENIVNSDNFNDTFLSMMIETDANSGVYEDNKNGVWPQTGYTFNSSLSKCENGSAITWDDVTKSVSVNSKVSDKCYVYFDAPQPLLADYIKGKYTSQGARGLYHHDNTLANGAGDNSYRYAGVNPNNYVCFGSDAVPCPEDNLYRIIGVFGDQVKLIKYDYATVAQLGTDGDYSQTYAEWGMDNTYKGQMDGNKIGVYYWNNSTNNNNWNESNLNKINLNTNYINKLGTTWTNKIATTTWKVGGNTFDSISRVIPANSYKNEIVTPAVSTTYNAKIGLIYVSDYGLAADPSSWTTTVGDYHSNSIPSKNWMYMGLYEWTISRMHNRINESFFITSLGHFSIERLTEYIFAIRPVFYINQWELYDSGDGTKENPIRMKSPDNLIAFTISDPDGSNTIQYYAENEMTWEQFVNSKYNVNGIYNDGDYIRPNKEANNGFRDIKPTDIIQSKNNYKWWPGAIGGSN